MSGSPDTPAELLREAFRNPEFADRVCLEDAETGQSYTYADMENMTASAVPLLWSLGIKKGDVVSLLLENGPHFFGPWLGTMRAGAVVHPMNFFYKSADVLYALKLCESKLLVADYKFLYDAYGNPKELTALLQKELPELRIVLMRKPQGVSGHMIVYESWEKLMDALPGRPRYHGTVPRAESDAFQLICTSGTTGDPKAVVQHNDMFFPNVQDLIDVYKFTQDDIGLLVNRMFHVNAQVANFFPMALLGGKTVLLNFDRRRPELLWQAIQEHNITYSSVIPPMLGMVENAKKIETPSLRFFIVGADILTPERHTNFVEKTDVELRPGWGMTETLCWGSGTRKDEVQTASIGTPLPHTHMKIVDPDNDWQKVPDGVHGRLIVWGANVFRQYLNNEKATQKAFAPSSRWGKGWFDTGDTCYQAADGTFYFVCRANADSWKMRGEFIVGPVLDEYLEGRPDIEAAVAAPLVMDEQTETVMLVVAQSPDSKTAEKLWQYCEEGRKSGKLEAYYKVRGIIFIESIELGDTGKRNRKRMTERLQEHYAGEKQAGWSELFDFRKEN